jgi:hypothetical protein
MLWHRGVLLLGVMMSLAWVAPSPVYGGEIYRWTGADGVVNFADSADDPEARVVHLPGTAALPTPRRNQALHRRTPGAAGKSPCAGKSGKAGCRHK